MRRCWHHHPSTDPETQNAVGRDASEGQEIRMTQHNVVLMRQAAGVRQDNKIHATEQFHQIKPHEINGLSLV